MNPRGHWPTRVIAAVNDPLPEVCRGGWPAAKDRRSRPGAKQQRSGRRGEAPPRIHSTARTEELLTSDHPAAPLSRRAERGKAATSPKSPPAKPPTPPSSRRALWRGLPHGEAAPTSERAEQLQAAEGLGAGRSVRPASRPPAMLPGPGSAAASPPGTGAPARRTRCPRKSRSSSRMRDRASLSLGPGQAPCSTTK